MNAVVMKHILLLAAIGCLLAVFPACHKETEQDKVRKIITTVQKASEEKDIKKIVSSLSKSYQDNQGYDYDTIKGLLLGYFYQHQKVHVYIPDLVVSVEGAAAKAEFQAVLTGDQTGSAVDILPEALGVYTFDVSFRKEQDEWKVTSARWDRVGESKQ